MTSWPVLLDALEEHLRRVEAAIRGDDVEVLAPELVADGPLPPEYADRAAALLQRTRDVEAMGRERRGELQRAMAYVQ